MRKLFFLVLSWIVLEGGTVRLVNDSVFKLDAEIKGADGTSLSKVTLNSQQVMTWDDYAGGRGGYNQSRTPYTVLWYCPSGETFGVSSNIATGSVTSALASSGSRACKMDNQSGKPSDKNSKMKQAPASSGDSLLQQNEQEEQQDAGPPEGLLE